MNNNNKTPNFTEHSLDLSLDYGSSDYTSFDSESAEGTSNIITEDSENPVDKNSNININAKTYVQSDNKVTEYKDLKDGFSISSLILGIVSNLICCIFPVFAIISAVFAIIFSIMSIKYLGGKKSPFAVAGFICAAVCIFFFIIYLVSYAFLENRL